MLILYFVRDKSLGGSGKSPLVADLMDYDPEYWTDKNILLLIVGIEHLLIAVKYSINSFIDDTPHHIKKAEKKQKLLKKKAKRYLKSLKDYPDFENLSNYELRIEAEAKLYKKEEKAREERKTASRMGKRSEQKLEDLDVDDIEQDHAPAEIVIEKRAFVKFVKAVHEENIGQINTRVGALTRSKTFKA